MRHLQPVAWSKGIFLTPQHLQAQDHFFDDSLNFVMNALSSYHWGFSSLLIDTASISEGRLQVETMHGLFPDGLPFDTTSGDRAPGARLLDECFVEGQLTCTFYLAIQQQRDGGTNIALQRNGPSARFSSELQMLRDELNPGVEKPVALARKNLQILAEGENLDGLIVLPLARILLTESGRYALDPDFIAPMLNVDGNERLKGVLRRLVEILVSHSAQIAGGRRQRNQSLADFTASDIASFWMLYTINSHLPVLNDFYRSPRVHPETIFTEILSLGGALTTFSHQIDPISFPRYAHDDLGSCVLQLEALILKLLNTVIPSRFVALPLTSTRDSIYVTEIDKDDYLSGTAYLAIAADISASELIARTPALLKACSATHLETLIRQALPGVPLTHMPSPPSQIPVKLAYQYFSLDRSGPAWDTIKRSRNFGVYVPSELANARLELILIPLDDPKTRNSP
jgi:type VI secretion system protein ImpJ